MALSDRPYNSRYTQRYYRRIQVSRVFRVLPSFVEISEATGNMEEGHPSHLLSNVTLAIGKGVTLSIDTADAGSLAEFVLKLVKEGGICSD